MEGDRGGAGGGAGVDAWGPAAAGRGGSGAAARGADGGRAAGGLGGEGVDDAGTQDSHTGGSRDNLTPRPPLHRVERGRRGGGDERHDLTPCPLSTRGEGERGRGRLRGASPPIPLPTSGEGARGRGGRGGRRPDPSPPSPLSTRGEGERGRGPEEAIRRGGTPRPWGTAPSVRGPFGSRSARTGHRRGGHALGATPRPAPARRQVPAATPARTALHPGLLLPGGPSGDRVGRWDSRLRVAEMVRWSAPWPDRGPGRGAGPAFPE